MEGLLRFSGFLDASLVRYLMDPQENEAAFDGEAHEVEPSDHSLHHSAEDDRSHLQSGDGASPEFSLKKGFPDCIVDLFSCCTSAPRSKWTCSLHYDRLFLSSSFRALSGKLRFCVDSGICLWI
ncbi:uncharacterized protein LOC116198132 [Punica granatum]|uniref:Uncharacterized protein LOC116198132 n=1 Tax=Punica granatum TaxID=22663 RepID=A0A6P8CY31_PUNGR|nr:uncharacterized protein LOC116198132 [Punica granatum]